MRSSLLLIALLITGLGVSCAGEGAPGGIMPPSVSGLKMVALPPPDLSGRMTLEEAISSRRSVREYSTGPLTLKEVSQLLWAAQGVTGGGAGRSAPSAGALYPLEVVLVAGGVEGLAPGVYRYLPEAHQLRILKEGDLRRDLSAAALDQEWVREGSVNVVISGVYERTTRKYGDRGVRYAHMEAGHAAQNVCLEATALGLGTVTVGAFDDGQVRAVLGLAANETPLYVMPVGRKP